MKKTITADERRRAQAQKEIKRAFRMEAIAKAITCTLYGVVGALALFASASIVACIVNCLL